ncbi:hypothetical protein GFH48_27255 [Streptomyces fagopyri]|uniref:Uncharacterized protein n=1 Tax=Streptomyces fagopyri TaxID=2662397 RepID=A0A5Q0LIU9_9ACTN|nr:hypothetical protein GFH48_27255 [Streptomyces fagopyri]
MGAQYGRPPTTPHAPAPVRTGSARPGVRERVALTHGEFGAGAGAGAGLRVTARRLSRRRRVSGDDPWRPRLAPPRRRPAIDPYGPETVALAGDSVIAPTAPAAPRGELGAAWNFPAVRAPSAFRAFGRPYSKGPSGSRFFRSATTHPNVFCEWAVRAVRSGSERKSHTLCRAPLATGQTSHDVQYLSKADSCRV